ncbi:hypothetical protein [Streptomyces sp. NPDC058308]|uniref:hypothetical protein n=1 Tax=Streptomyces sp. NPDC058308 TaxID=3346440 RepID=UPI0036E9B952
MPWVEEHERGGTKVRRYFRWAPGAKRDLSILVVLGLAAVGYGGTAGSAGGDGSGSAPRPTSTATYPVHFEGWDDPAPAPRPTVSYPIRFDHR